MTGAALLVSWPSGALLLGLGWAALVDLAILYGGLIRRRAEQGRREREAQEVGLRSLGRVMLLQHEHAQPPAKAAEEPVG